MNGPVLVFDLDDTLYPERAYALSGFAAAAAWAKDRLGIESLEHEMTRLLDAGHLGRLFGMALAGAKPDHSAEELAGLLEAYRQHTPQIALYDDAVAVLGRYPAADLGLITDGAHAMQRAKVTALGIEALFGAIVYTDTLGRGRAYAKPHARAFEMMQRSLSNGGRPMVYIGDNPAKDFVAPNALGWTTVQVLRPWRIHAHAATAPGGAPRHIVETLAELPRVLGL